MPSQTLDQYLDPGARRGRRCWRADEFPYRDLLRELLDAWEEEDVQAGMWLVKERDGIIIFTTRHRRVCVQYFSPRRRGEVYD